MNQSSSFGSFVRQRRREMDLTQEELARRVGCAAITLRKIEGDDLRASVQIAERLAMALAIPLEERAEFVRWARSVHPQSSNLPAVTPPPSMEEIGREDLTGRAIRGYALAERIGMGGMGSVYRAVQPNVDREVAVKIILPAFANHPDFIRRFEAEAQLVARLEHPHIVPLYDYWREPGVAYLVMRFLRGGNVQSLLSQGPLAVEMTTRMLEQICSALNTAHRIGVIHRDLKPANVLLDEDNNAYLADFGIAKNLGNPDLESQTQLDVMIGSPQYMSPEQIRSLSVRPQTDIYCLGVMLYEMLTGAPPFTGPTPFDFIQQHINTPMPPLSANRAGLPFELDAVIARATAKDPDVRYADSLSLFNDFRQAAGRVIGAQTVINIEYEEEESNLEISNPFKGLRAFNEADAENFFGRETLVQQLLARLGEGGDLSRFLAVIGPSGSGKSSVVRAGIIPALKRGGLPGSENWFIVDMLPGKHPFEELEASLLRVAVNPPQTLLSQLKDGERGILRAVHRILPEDESVELVLVIDQFEEVFTLVEDESERASLLESLAAAVLDERSRLRVIITLRADFTDKPLRYVDFGELLNRRFEFVLPLTADEVERAVAGPAQRAGLKLEKGLVSTIIRDAGNQPGALPLLQYALSELFEKRAGRTLTNQAYKEIGGVLGALGRRAEAVYADLDERSRSTARQLFLRLVTLGEGTEDTRRRVLGAELENLTIDDARQTMVDGPLSTVIGAFGNARLLTFDRDPLTRGATIEVAHEALLREWTRLREWLNESRADVRIQRQLANAVNEWQSADCNPGFLMAGSRLEQFEGWAASTTVLLTQDERAFLDASIAERDRREAEERARQQRELEAAQKLAQTEHARAVEQTQSANRLRTRNRVITTVGSFALILALVAGMFGVQSNQNASAAQNSAATAQVAKNKAVNAQATSEAERLQAESEKQIAISRELAGASLVNLNIDPERSILLALQAEKHADTFQAQDALHRAVQTSRLLKRVDVPLGGCYCSIAFSPDNTRLVTESRDAQGQLTTQIRDAATLEVLFSKPGIWADDRWLDANYLPIAKPSDDRSSTIITVWDATGQNVITTVTLPIYYDDNGPFVDISPDRTKVAAVSSEDRGNLSVFDMATGKMLPHIGKLGYGYNGMVRFSPDSKSLLTIGARTDTDQETTLWDVATGHELLSVPARSGPSFIDFSPDGKQFAVDELQTVRIVDIASGQNAVILSGHTALVQSGLQFNKDGTRIVTVAGDGTLRIWDSVTGQSLLTIFGDDPPIRTAAFNSEGTQVATLGSTSLQTWAILPTEPHEWLAMPARVDCYCMIAYSPDGKQLAAFGDDNTVKIMDSHTGQTLLTLPDPDNQGRGLAFSPDGKRLVTSGGDNMAHVWDLLTGKELLSLEGHSAPVDRVIYSPDGTRIATMDRNHEARLWDAVSGQKLFSMYTYDGGIQESQNVGIAFSPDGSRLATAGQMFVKIWDTSTGREVLALPVTPDVLAYTVAFSPDGKHLAVGLRGAPPSVWDIATVQKLFDMYGHIGSVRHIAYSPDGTRIATASTDGTTRLWDAATGAEQFSLAGQPSVVTGLAFSPDGSRLATTTRDGIIRVYALNLKDLIQIALSHLTRELRLEECRQYLHVATCPAD